MKKLIILSLLLVWCGILDGTMDTVKFKFDESIFTSEEPRAELGEWFYYWSYPESWRNRYINGDPAQGVKWYFDVPFNFIPYDFWHTLKTLLLLSIFFTMYYCSLHGFWLAQTLPFDEKSIIQTWYYPILFMAYTWILYGGMHELFMVKILITS